VEEVIKNEDGIEPRLPPVGVLVKPIIYLFSNEIGSKNF